MQFKDLQNSLPLEWLWFDASLHAQARRRIDWVRGTFVDPGVVQRLAGASESSRRLRFAVEPRIESTLDEALVQLPVAVALSFHPWLDDTPADRAALHPARGALQSATEWQPVVPGDGDGLMTRALVEDPLASMGLLRNLTLPTESIRKFLDGVSAAAGSSENPEGLLVNAAMLVKLPFEKMSTDKSDGLSGTFAGIEVVRSVHHLLVGCGFRGALEIAWPTIFSRLQHWSLLPPLTSASGVFDDLFERRISPLRAVGEIDRGALDAADGEAGVLAWARSRLKNIGYSCLGSTAHSTPDFVRSFDGHDLDNIYKMVERLLKDHRAQSVHGELHDFGQEIKKFTGMLGKKARLERGRWFVMAVGALRQAMAKVSATVSEERGIEWVRSGSDDAQREAEVGRLYFFGWQKALDLTPPPSVGGSTEAEFDSGTHPDSMEVPSQGDTVVRPDHMGHLFLDMKDFTGRTAVLKESNMAEFMRWDFYEPLLRNAKEYYRGMSHLQDQGGIIINNLLGDALSVSGEIVALVSYARDCNKILQAYRQKLVGKENKVARKEQLRSRAEACRVKANDLAKQFKEAADTSAKATIRKSYEAAKAQYELYKREYETFQAGADEIAEFGTYIAYGAPPIRVDFEDEIFGSVSVAISEHINESARGTARDGVLWSGLTRAYELERKKNPDIGEIAFQVYLGDVVRLGEVEDTTVWNNQLRDGKQKFDQVPLAQQRVLFNAGLALSGEALLAYLHGVKPNNVRSLLCDGKTFQEAIRPLFWMPDEQRIMAVDDGNGRWFARLAGDIVFKGFENKRTALVWEIIEQGEISFDAVNALTASAPVLRQDQFATWCTQVSV